MDFWVYVLYNQTAGKRYIGQTDDLERRVGEHNDTKHNPMKFTSKHPGPWVLVYSEQFTTRSEAMRRERWFKSGQGRAWLDARGIGRAIPPQADEPIGCWFESSRKARTLCPRVRPLRTEILPGQSPVAWGPKS